MFCAKCGNPDISTKFCPKCGAPVTLQPGDTQAAKAAQPRDAGPAMASAQSPKPQVQQAAVVRKQSVPPPPKPPRAKPPETDKFLDGTVFAADNRTNCDSATSDADSQAANGKPKVKVDPVFKKYTPGETGLFGSMFYLISDPETFFTRVDFTKEVGTAFMVIFIVNIARGTGSLIMKLLLSGKMPEGKELDGVILGSAFAFIYPFLVSVLGMIVMSLLYKAFASWKRIFGIYAFASVPFLISFLPFFGLISFFLYVYYARKGFENVFGLESGASLLFALGLPFLFWSAVILTFGSAIMLGGR
jgi:hypothetical protein